MTPYQFLDPYNIILPRPESFEVGHFISILALNGLLRGSRVVVRQCCSDPKIGMQLRFGSNSTVEFDSTIPQKFRLPYCSGFMMLQGDLLIMNALTAEPYCGCDPLLLRQYYFSPLGLCYEHNTRGPCETGLLFAYNHTAQVSQFEAWKIQTQQMCMKIIDCFKICSKRWKTGNFSNTLPF